MLLVVLILLHTAKLPLFLTVEGFTYKNECLLDFLHDEYEGDENKGGRGGHINQAWPAHNGGAWPGPSPTELNSFVAPPTGFHGGMDAEDWRERMGWDEEEEGMSHAYGNGRGVIGGRFGAGEEADEGDWGWDKRKRRRRQASFQGYQSPGRHTPTSLSGTLVCDQTAMIHIFNVTVGYSSSSYCYQAFNGCQAGSSKAKQVIHCQGRTGSCDFTIRRHFIARCGEMVNFANVAYECVPVSERINICSNTNSDISGATAIVSPSYPLATSQRLPPEAELLTCECILRAPSGSTFEVEYLRTHMSQKDGYCDGDMVLLERPDQTSRSLASARYSLEREQCGVNVSSHLTVSDSILRITFLGGAPLAGDTAGFLGKFKARGRSGRSELFHASCTGTDPAPDSESTTPSSRLSEWRRSRNPGLPPNFESSLVAKERDLARAANSQGHVSEQAESNLAEGVLPGFDVVRSDVVEENKGSKSDHGTLSGVVASLAAVILIMASVGALIFYKRHKKRLRRRAEEGDYTEYQSQGGVSARKEENVPRRSRAAPYLSASKRWSDSKLAEYGLMLVRVLGGQNHSRHVRDIGRRRDRTATYSGSGSADDVSGGNGSGSLTSREVYCVSPAMSGERNKQCLADVHQSLKPPTRRAPRPPLRPAPILSKADSPVANMMVCHSPVAPPRRQKTRKMNGGEQHPACPSLYDNVLDQDTAGSVTPTDVGCDGSKASFSKTALIDATATNNNIIINQKQSGRNGSAEHNDCDPTNVLKDNNGEDTYTKPQEATNGKGDNILKAGEEYKSEVDAESESETETSDSGESLGDVSDTLSEGEETYTSINELNEALHNLQQQIRDLPS